MDDTNYHPVTIIDGPKEGTVTTAHASAAAAAKGRNPGLWTRITNRAPFLQTKRGVFVTIGAILLIVGGGLAGLAALRNREDDGSGSARGIGGGAASSNAITSDLAFYGQSPPFYPSRM